MTRSMTFRLSRLAPLALLLLPVRPALAAPLSDRDAAQLRTACDEVVARTTLQRARAGILVTTEDGKVVYQHDPDDLLNPASNVKLFTAAAALAKLGPDYRWQTDFLLREPMKPNGEVKDLYVRGNGDPLLTTEKLYEVVAELYHQGLRTITGTLYLDDAYFDGERIGPGFDQETSDRAYMAPTGALSLNTNAVEINVFPGERPGAKARVELEPQSDYFVVENKATTARANDRGRVQVKLSREGDRQKIEVAGRLPLDKGGVQLWRKIDAPDLYFAATLRELLKARGIKLRGKTKHAVTPAEAKVLFTHESEPLDLAVRKMNKTSSNFIAEQLVKCLGAAGKGVPGSWPKGVEAIEDFLEQDVGIPRGQYVMKNGSGLNDTNRFSASQVVKLLAWANRRFTAQPEYLSSLGTVGKDGTVRSRMEGTEAQGRIRAKTGTLEGVTALSGVVESVGGQRFLFAILVNDYPGKHAQVTAAIDDLGVTIAAAGSALGPGGAARQMVAAATPLSSPAEELRARVLTYTSLGKLHDKHNLPFLRTALRTERDPALKAVVAEALFQCDPQDSAGARAVLDAWSATPEVFGRLLAVAHDLSLPVPVVGALLDVAAEGSAEGLARTVELAPLVQAEPALKTTLADGLEQISRNAPDELLAALRTAPADASRAALELLAQGVAASTEPQENPFPKALEAAQGAKDPELAAFAKATAEGYQRALAQAKAAPALHVAATAAPGAPPAPTPAPAPPQVLPAAANPALPPPSPGGGGH